MLRIGLLLSGCGSLDGSDPLQAIALRIAAARAGDLLFPLAPDRDQADVIGLQGSSGDPPRNALAESARLTGGRIDPLDAARADEFDVLAVVGGLGVLKSFETGSSSAGADLARGVLAQRGALLLFDEGVAWAARAVSANSGDEARESKVWQLAAGNDRLLHGLIAGAGHEPRRSPPWPRATGGSRP